jgi:hypothetical protein
MYYWKYSIVEACIFSIVIDAIDMEITMKKDRIMLLDVGIEYAVIIYVVITVY